MRYLSDLDTTTDGRFAIEWSDEFGRHWEHFNTEDERDAALQEFDEYCKIHQAEYREEKKHDIIRTCELVLEELDNEEPWLICFTEREIEMAKKYRKVMIQRYTHKSTGFTILELVGSSAPLPYRQLTYKEVSRG